MAIQKLVDVQDLTAHSFVAADAAATVARLVEQDAYLSALVGNNFSSQLMSGPNRTINIKIPSALIARERNIDDKQTGITLDEIKESTVPLTLGKMAYSAVSLSHEDLDFRISDFASQVLAPQADSISDYIENTVANTLTSVPVSNRTIAGHALEIPAYAPNTTSTNFETFAGDPYGWFVRLRTLLRKRGIPQNNLNVVVGTSVYQALLLTDKLRDASQSQSTAALREGSVGQMAGFTFVESTRVKDTEIFAFHRDAVTVAVRAPSAPSVPYAASHTNGGYPMSINRAFSVQNQSEIQTVSTYFGALVLPLYRVRRVYNANPALASATVEQVANGGIIHADLAVAQSVTA